MVLRLTDAYSSKPGSTIMIDGEAYVVKSNDISKSGKHGASKCRIEAIGVISGKKKIVAVPGSERFDVPMIEKKKAQVLSVADSSASIMDLESYETIDIVFICKDCSKKIRTQAVRVIAGKVKCPKCGSHAFRPVRKK